MKSTIHPRTRRVVVAATMLAACAPVVGNPSAQASEGVRSHITVRSSDYEVRSGEQFVLRGRMTSGNKTLAGATVRVQAYYSNGWRALSGAVVSTGDDGRYRVRVILSAGGDRDLRVVGDPASDRIRKDRAYTVVRVLS